MGLGRDVGCNGAFQGFAEDALPPAPACLCLLKCLSSCPFPCLSPPGIHASVEKRPDDVRNERQ